MTKKMIRLSLGPAALVAFLGSQADARTVPASAGKPVTASDAPCFAMGRSTMTNVCDGWRSYELPLPADSEGWKTVTITAYGATVDHNVGCTSVGADQNATTFWGGGYSYLNLFGSPQNIVTSSYLPAYGYLWANCFVGSGARIHKVDFNP
jgi:hypothetical protein